jgi:hypothetical protein
MKLQCGVSQLWTATGSKTAGDGFNRLFNLRSAFLHGRTMSPISSEERILARRLARETAVALIEAALARPASSARDAYLDELTYTGFNLA